MPTPKHSTWPQYVAILGSSGTPVGGGCLVGRRRVITCAHVVEAALGHNRAGALREAPRELIRARFPFAAVPFTTDCRVRAWNPVDNSYPCEKSEDLALLEVTSDAADDINPVEVTRTLFGHVSCYRAGPGGGHAFGTIVAVDEAGRIQINRDSTDGITVVPGFSGAPIFTTDSNELFCGILMTARGTDPTIFGKQPEFIREMVDADRESDVTGRKLLSQSAAEYVAEQRRATFGTSNPYMLGKQFHGRDLERSKLTSWIRGDDNDLQVVRVFCISDFGGMGKSALVHYWLNEPSTAEALRDAGLAVPFWASFYSRSVAFPDMLERLKEYLGIHVGSDFVVHGRDAYRRRLVDEILDSLTKKPAMIVLDGLEREMGAYADSVNRGLDSEEQDVRAESRKVPATERYLRDPLFQELMVGLVQTNAKVILTTRLVPEELRNAHEAPETVYVHELDPLGFGDACSIWNDALGNAEGQVDDFTRYFFELVGYSPQTIVVVGASLAAAPGKPSLKNWFERFELDQQVLCTDKDELKTRLRHRWIDLATQDLKDERRSAWLLLVELANDTSALPIERLRDITIRGRLDAEHGRPLFGSEGQFGETLELLERRRLLGIGKNGTDVDVHPVIRTRVRQWAFGVLRDPESADVETLRAIRGDGDGELAQRFWVSDVEQKFRTLQGINPDERDKLVGGQGRLRETLAQMYQGDGDTARPWMTRLPRFSLRKDQADCVHLTATALMAQGDWTDSRHLFRVATELYQLCGDQASVSECAWNMSWQLIYGGDLQQSERILLERLPANASPTRLKADRNLYWLLLLMSIRRHPLACRMVQAVKPDVDRWALQAVAEAKYYLQNYEAARSLIGEAIQRDEPVPRRQELWEWVTAGLTDVRAGRCEQGRDKLARARAEGMGLQYEIIALFALAGHTEALFQLGVAELDPTRSHYLLSSGIQTHRQYRNMDPNDQYQIPACDAHLGAARIFEELGRQEDAIEWGCRALNVARQRGRPFCYASGEERAVRFLEGICPARARGDAAPAANAIELRQHESLIQAVVSRIEEVGHADE